MRFAPAIWLLLPGVLLGQTPTTSVDWRQVLQQVRHKVVEAVGKSDNYICLQELSRSYYEVRTAADSCRQPPEIPSVPQQARDRLKLDVAVSEGLEIYSWHGEHKFSGGNVGQLVRKGPISSGSFNGYLRNVFSDGGVRFLYTGRIKADGLDVYRFDYNVPLDVSHYRVQVASGMETVPFHGSFAVRSDNLELYSMVVTASADSISKKSNLCSIQTTVVYQSVPIGNHQSLLPKSYELLMGTRQALVTDSKGIYSGCKAYTGESTVHFDDASVSTSDAAPVLTDAEPLRPDLALQVALNGSIDEDTAYAGEPVEAVLTHNVKIGKGKVLARGATLRGTITNFEIYDARPRHVTVNIEFNSITDGKNLYLCTAVHSIPLKLPGSNPFSQTGEQDMDDGSMVFYRPHLHLDQHFTTIFMTVDHAETESQ